MPPIRPAAPRLALSFLAVALSAASLAHAQTPGSLDPAFGTNQGITTVQFGEVHIGKRLAVDGDGWLVAGYTRLPADNTKTPKHRATLSRFTSAGVPDAPFGDDGIAVATVGFRYVAAAALARDANRVYLVVVGSLPGDAYQRRLHVFAFTHTGIPDTSYGDGGVFTMDTKTDNWNLDAVLQNGKLVIASSGVPGDSGRRPMLLRLTTDGQLDPTFAGGGRAYYDAPAGQPDYAEFFDRVLMLPDQRLLLAGRARQPAGETDLMVMRVDANGAPDTSFGTLGARIVDVQQNEHPGGLARMADGRILVAAASCEGPFNQYSFCDLAVARLTANGALDPTYADAGVALHRILPASMPSDTGSQPNALRVDAQGRATIAGQVYDPLDSAYLVRLRADGTLDPAFGTGGVVLNAYGEDQGGTGGALDLVQTTVLIHNEPQPRLFTTGYFAPLSGGIRAAIARHIDAP